MRKACLVLALVVATPLVTALSTAVPAGASADPPPYYPSGPQLGVDQSALTGWQACWSGSYADTPLIADVLAACDGDYLLLASGPADSSVFDVLAAAPRADVLTSTAPDTVHDANGTGWYFDDGSWIGAWGFAPSGDTTHRIACDVTGSSREDGPDGDRRLCWHLLPRDGTLGVGWRSGTDVDLFGTDHRRAIYEPAPDSVPPTVTCSVTPSVVWPPNHKLLAVAATVAVTDEGSGPAGSTLVSVTSNEADSGTGAGDLPGDVQHWTTGTADTSGSLRAERADTGPGRVYTLTYEGADGAGNTARCSATVVVPHDSGDGSTRSSTVTGPRGTRS